MSGPLISLGILVVGAILSALCGRRSLAAARVALLSVSLAAAAGTPTALRVLVTGRGVSWRAPWSLPWGSLSVALDPLSAFFIAFILLLAVPFAFYGRGYLARHRGSSWHSLSWSLFQILVASMVLVVSAADGLLLLMAWEAMSVASLFLVIHDHEEEGVLKDGLVYAVAAHLGVAALLGLFALWGSWAGSLRFADLSAVPLGRGASWTLFLLAVAGFGSKAGLAPFHVWLPKAHPAAPSHVSALMSGVMIKMGIYGILRILLLLGGWRPGWGYLLLAMGGSSALMGVLYALGQHDLKRLLAYHSVENVGIITIGIGAGVLARTAGMEIASLLAFMGALLHVLNHGLFKGLLFCGGGAAAQASGTREMDALGGLLKRMPWTGTGFLIGSMAICALPPLNGFASEFLIYSGLLSGALSGRAAPSLVLFFSVPVLALAGGLALACFAKAFGVAFLGEPRSAPARDAREANPWMIAPMMALALACIVIGLLAPLMVSLIAEPASALAGVAAAAGGGGAAAVLTKVALAGWALLLLAAILSALRWLLLRGRTISKAPTWGCGFSAPTARMQYTASSFAEPLLGPLRGVLRPRVHLVEPRGLFPEGGSFSSHLEDWADKILYEPLFGGAANLAGRVRPLQQGRLQLYLLYTLLALIALLLWQVLA